MRVSAGLPTGMEGLTYPIPFSDPENVIRIAQAAEKFGYDSVWGNDHMTTQNYVRAEFPVPPRFWEPLITYAFVLSETKTIKVGTGILVLPMRHDIVVTAKQIATLDHFSNGRVEIGVGIGAYREEFEALNPQASVHRGDMVVEGVTALRLLFSQRAASFDGKYYNFRDVELFPKPKQQHLPIYFGGNNPAHLRRTAASGDGWIPALVARDHVAAWAARSALTVAGQNVTDPSIPLRVQWWVPSRMFSRTVNCGKTRMFWKVRATPWWVMRCAGSRTRSRPSKRTDPVVGRRTPEIRLNTVVFPAPFGPTRLTISPSLTSTSKRSTAVSPPKRRVKPRISRTGVRPLTVSTPDPRRSRPPPPPGRRPPCPSPPAALTPRSPTRRSAVRASRPWSGVGGWRPFRAGPPVGRP